jgi:6-phosphogluconate dehydrogenase
MQIAMVGLGRMGANMARRLVRGGHEVVVWNREPERARELEREGARAVARLEDLARELRPPRAAWIMLPAGEVTEQTVQRIAANFERGDLLVDGGNSHYKDDARRAKALAPRGIHYLDCGTSGGVWGLERGYCLMVGGPAEAVLHLEPALRTLAPGRGEVAPTPGRAGGSAEQGYLHCGPSGAGHFVKMIHNGIEYGIMQAYAEGFEILKNANKASPDPELRYDMQLAEIAELWRRGSVVGSWLLDLTAMALQEDPSLARFTGHVQDSGEGRWTVQAAIESATPAHVLTSALFTRFRSRQENPYAEKLLSAMREKFGGHVESKAKE